jgi:hypothetical protein
MKISCAAIFAATTLAAALGSAPSALACNGNGNCENAPGHNKDLWALPDLSLAQGFPF